MIRPRERNTIYIYNDYKILVEDSSYPTVLKEISRGDSNVVKMSPNILVNETHPHGGPKFFYSNCNIAT